MMLRVFMPPAVGQNVTIVPLNALNRKVEGFFLKYVMYENKPCAQYALQID